MRLVLPSVLLAAAVTCGRDPSGPQRDPSLPPQGARASAITDASGLAALVFTTGTTTVRVVDGAGEPVSGARVGATVGNENAVFAAMDPARVLPPTFAIHPISSLAAPAVVPPADANVALPLIEPITLLLAGAAVSIGLGLWELLGDPIQWQLVVDDGVLKSCTAYDWADVATVVTSLASAGLIVVGLTTSTVLSVLIQAGVELDIAILGKALDVLDKDRVAFCTVLVGDQNFSLQLVVVTTVTGGGILAQDARVPSHLWFVEPAGTMSEVDIGPIRTAFYESPYITDMAVWDSVAFQQGSAVYTSPVVYATSFRELFRLRRRTATIERIASLGDRGINALTFSPNGTLYAMGQTAELLELSAATGSVVRTLALNPPVASSGDLQFLPDGRLVATVTGVSGDQLVEIHPGSGAVRIIGDVGYNWVFGLAFFDGTLWGVTGGGQLLRINPQTGKGTRERNLAFVANGASARARSGPG